MCPTMSDTAMDTSSEIITMDLKEKKEVVEEVESGKGILLMGRLARWGTGGCQ